MTIKQNQRKLVHFNNAHMVKHGSLN